MNFVKVMRSSRYDQKMINGCQRRVGTECHLSTCNWNDI